ncbi:MAG TPA: hypothetical protein VG474_09715 [Solirubrobacteraceae bacterium]|nr:hypothetical protein [Solirubrobacteraceae bacterium]
MRGAVRVIAHTARALAARSCRSSTRTEEIPVTTIPTDRSDALVERLFGATVGAL